MSPISSNCLLVARWHFLSIPQCSPLSFSHSHFLFSLRLLNFLLSVTILTDYLPPPPSVSPSLSVHFLWLCCASPPPAWINAVLKTSAHFLEPDEKVAMTNNGPLKIKCSGPGEVVLLSPTSHTSAQLVISSISLLHHTKGAYGKSCCRENMPEEGKMKRQLKELIVGGAGGTVLGLHKPPHSSCLPSVFYSNGRWISQVNEGGIWGRGRTKQICFWKTSWWFCSDELKKKHFSVNWDPTVWLVVVCMHTTKG